MKVDPIIFNDHKSLLVRPTCEQGKEKCDVDVGWWPPKHQLGFVNFHKEKYMRIKKSSGIILMVKYSVPCSSSFTS